MRLVQPTLENLYRTALQLRAGHLCAFPTETVYGLGALASNRNAILNVFKTKKRPLSDPLILHLFSSYQLESFVSWTTDRQREIAMVLCNAFWPGPLTMLLPVNRQSVLAEILAGNETVALRMPGNAIALSLLRFVRAPLVAPSANVFSHVSPTTAQHVLDDFPDENFPVIEGGSTEKGIESTIVKIESDRVLIVRRGVITERHLANALATHKLDEVSILEPRDLPNALAPGLSLKHYSPKIPLRMMGEPYSAHTLPDNTAVVDVGGRLKMFELQAMFYCDLSQECNWETALQDVYATLREIEKNPNIKSIVVPDLSREQDGLARALCDKFYRAASGKFLGA